MDSLSTALQGVQRGQASLDSLARPIGAFSSTLDAVAVRNGKTIKGDILTAYMVKAKPAGAKPAEAKSATQAKRPAPAGTGKPPATPAARADRAGEGCCARKRVSPRGIRRGCERSALRLLLNPKRRKQCRA